MINRFWTKIFTHFPYYMYCYLCDPMSVHHYYCKIIITMKLSQFDNASSWSKSLFVKVNMLWICRKYLSISCNFITSQNPADFFRTINIEIRFCSGLFCAGATASFFSISTLSFSACTCSSSFNEGNSELVFLAKKFCNLPLTHA